MVYFSDLFLSGERRQPPIDGHGVDCIVCGMRIFRGVWGRDAHLGVRSPQQLGGRMGKMSKKCAK